MVGIYVTRDPLGYLTTLVRLGPEITRLLIVGYQKRRPVNLTGRNEIGHLTAQSLTRRLESSPQDRDLHQPRDRAPSGANMPRSTDPARETRELPAPAKPMPPPSQPEIPGPIVNPERARLINAERSDDRFTMKPARAALLDDGRHSRDDSRDRNSSRVASPRRGDRSEAHGGEPPREERRVHRGEHHIPGRDQRNEPQGTSARNGRMGDHDVDRLTTDRSRESPAFLGQAPSTRGEPEHGRLNMQDPEYGRLSSIPSIGDMGNPPEGPRGRGRNAARGHREHSTSAT